MANKKNICIIGGGGFIGAALRNYFFQKGYHLFTTGRAVDIALFPDEVYYSVNEFNYRQLYNELKNIYFEAIIDLAYTSVPNTSYEDPVKDFSENLTNVTWHLEFADSLKAGKFIYVSSGGTVYGDGAKEPSQEKDSNYPLSPYGITKLACERYVYMHHRIHALPAIIVRPSNLYGPGQKPFRGQGLIATALALAYKNKAIHIFGDGSHVRDYLFIDDFCEAIGALIENGQAGETYNVGSSVGVSINEIVNLVNSVVKKDEYKLNYQHLPERPFDVHYNVLNTDKFRSLTGWVPATEIIKGIQQTWHWIKDYMDAPAVAE